MKSGNLHIMNAGAYTTIQDKGRKGYAHLGIPRSGVFDQPAYQIGNWLVGNPLTIPAIEISGPGFSCRFDAPVMIAITGADGYWTVNDRPIPMYESIKVKKDDVLTLGKLENGYRSYLAIGGNLVLAVWLGSASAFRIHQSKVLPKDSWLNAHSQVRIQEIKPFAKKVFPKEGIPTLANLNLIRVTPGPEFDQFSDEQLTSFFQEGYQVSLTSNRMGLRLDGVPLQMIGMKEMLSSGICLGTIQINNQGLPMVLGTDAQTMGGYPRIAVVIAADMYKIAQLRPGNKFAFKLVSLEEAIKLNQYQSQRLHHFFAS